MLEPRALRALYAGLTLAACLGVVHTPAAAAILDEGGAVSAPPIALIRHDIAPSTIDADAHQGVNARTGAPDNHLTLAPSAPGDRVGRLYLFIGGTGSSELITQDVLNVGAQRGYNTIAIAYSNDQAVGTLCLGSLDDACTADVRQEILTGEDASSLVTVTPADALEPRLLKLLNHLAATYPAEGWADFLTADGAVDWSKVSAVGHSQGAGHVAYLAKRHAMFRSVMISGVADITSEGLAAPWLSRPNVTPPERQYGFTHVADGVVSLPVATRSWRLLGLAAYGPLTLTDGAAAPYGGSHQLTTAMRSPALTVDGLNAHVAMIADADLPRAADGAPAYRPVWEYMAFPSR